MPNQVTPSVDHFHDLVSNIPGVVYQFMIDPHGNYSLPYVGPTVYEYLGLNPDEVTQDVEKLFSLTHPDDLPGLHASIAESVQSMTQWVWEGRFLKDGTEVRWFRGSSNPKRQEDGGVLWNGVFIDITDKKHAEQALDDKRALYQHLVESSQAIPWELSLDTWRFTYVGPQAEKVLGYPAEDWYKENFWVDRLHPEDRDTAVGYCQNETTQGNNHSFEYRMIASDGSIVWIGDDVCVLKRDGKPFKLQGYMFDITRRKEADEKINRHSDSLEEQIKQRSAELSQSEAKLSNILENTGDAYLAVDNDWRITFANKIAKQLLDINPEEVIGKDLREELPDIVSMFYKIFRTTLTRKKAQESVVFYGPTMKYIEAHTCPTEKGMTAYFRDITRSKKIEDRLIRSKDDAERANEAKTEFLSRMSHELRTPLNAILGFGQLLEIDGEEFSGSNRDSLSEIMGAGYHLLDMVNEILDLARIEAGKMEVSIKPQVLADVVSECLKLIQTQAQFRHVEIVDETFGKNHVVLVDKSRLKQALINLLSNAVKYNREGGRITLSSEILDNRRLRINVTDTGEGLTEQQIDKLFISFERPHEKNYVEGAGIGLVITKNLVELMDGKIGVVSTPDTGSTFWIEFDLASE